VLDLDCDLDAPPVRDLLIEGDTIIAVGTRLAADAVRDAETIEATGKLVIPGLINAHFHSHDVLARGLMENLPLESWGTMAGALGSGRSRAEVRARTLAGAVECLRNGITTVQDMSAFSPLSDEYLDTIMDAYAEAGIRVIYSVLVRDLSQIDTIPWIRELAPAELHDFIGTQRDDPGAQINFVERQVDRIGDRGGLVRWALSPSAPQRCTPALLEAIAELSRRRELPVYTHVYETRTQRVYCHDRLAAYGGSAVRLMEATGLLGPQVTIAHGVWSESDEIDLIGRSGTNVVLNMLSNLKLKSGVAPVLEYRARAVNLALGCDNCSCSDVQSLLQVMKLFCLLSAVSSPERNAVTAADAFRAATVGGARTAGLEDTLGALRPGFKADLAILDLDDPAYVPLNSAVRQLVYGDSGRAIETVIVNGRVVVRDRRLVRLDETALREELRGLMPVFRADFESLRRDYERVRPYLDEVHRRSWAAPLSINRFVGVPGTASATAPASASSRRLESAADPR
jgi:cytosine/adenosine deaminase-related metal-dependent hydrolase